MLIHINGKNTILKKIDMLFEKLKSSSLYFNNLNKQIF